MGANSGRGARKFDLVLFGATGFTGKLVAEYLASRLGMDKTRWALAGRDLRKLEAVRAELAAHTRHAAGLDLLVADSGDRAALDRIAAQAHVVLSTVGPYGRHGSLLVAACAAHGTDYADLAGETPWIRRMIDAHHEEARRTGARIVPCCGFDSIPSDLGTLLLQETAIARDGQPCDRVGLYVTRMGGTFSGGSVASMMGVMEEAKDPAVRRQLADPYMLGPDGDRTGPDRNDDMGLSYDRDVGGWTAPFIMAAVNTRVVRRSHALLGYPWGRDFRYAERTLTGPGPAGLARAVGLLGALGGFGLGLVVPPLRWLLAKTVLPAPGEGPSRRAIENGSFTIRLVGHRGPALQVQQVTVRGRRDPGYGATAVMLAEAGLCLATDDRTDRPSGVLTPATALGTPLIDRLNATGIVTFEAEPAAAGTSS